MGLGVLLHTANIYSPGAGWLVGDAQTHPFFGWLAGFIHVFRMPAFFWISGYFCAMGFVRNGAGALLTTRMPRLLVPLLATALLLNVAQDLLLGWHRGAAPQAVLAQGLHLHHLWFLVDLLIFTALALALLPVMRRLIQRWPLRRAPAWPLLVLACALGTYAIEAVVRLSGFGYTPLLKLTTLYELARYFPYFVGGLLMHLLPALRDRLAAVPAWLFVPAALAVPWLNAWDNAPQVAWAEAAHLGSLVATWLSVGALLGLFARWFPARSALTDEVSDSAYSVYLFHHLLVVALGLALLPLAIGPWLKFVLVCAAAGGLAWAAHRLLVRRVRVLRYLFNGK